jgi:hypothetical protein
LRDTETIGVTDAGGKTMSERHHIATGTQREARIGLGRRARMEKPAFVMFLMFGLPTRTERAGEQD